VRFKKVIEELNSTWSPKQFSATSVPPRKDFVPFNKQDQAGYGSQRNADFPNSTAVPPNPATMPFPLEHVIDDLADSCIYLDTALKKIARCCKHNPSISDKQRQELTNMYSYGRKALKAISKIGVAVQDTANIAGQPTPDASVPVRKKEIKRN
jgi:hypothetical protein